MSEKLLKHVLMVQLWLRGLKQSLLKRENAKVAIIMLAFVFLFVIPDAASAAGGNPLQVMKNVYMEQAKENAFPVIILQILVLGIVISFAMGKFMPFILAIVASVIIAISPELAPNFNPTSITPAAGW